MHAGSSLHPEAKNSLTAPSLCHSVVIFFRQHFSIQVTHLESVTLHCPRRGLCKNHPRSQDGPVADAERAQIGSAILRDIGFAVQRFPQAFSSKRICLLSCSQLCICAVRPCKGPLLTLAIYKSCWSFADKGCGDSDDVFSCATNCLQQ